MPFETDEVAEVVTLEELQSFLEEHRMSITMNVNLSRRPGAGVTFMHGQNSFSGDGATIAEALRNAWAKRP